MQRLLFLALAALGVTLGAALLLAPDAQAGGGGHGCGIPREGRDETVAIEGLCYTPALLRVEPGDTVEWRNDPGNEPHNVTLFDGELVGGVESLAGGNSVTRAFSDTGAFAYYCSIHPGMIGIVVVEDAATSATGLEPASEVHGDDDGGLSAGAVSVIALSVGVVTAGGIATALRLRRRGDTISDE